jgi:hypothetical protein
MNLRGKTLLNKKKEVLLLRPVDHRGAKLNVKRESDAGLKCHKYEGIEYLVYKHGPGWSFAKEDKFLAVEGTPITTYISQDDELKEVSVLEFLRFAWGDTNYYNRLPDELKDLLEGTGDHRWAATVTVKPQELDPMLELDPLKAQAILREHNIEMMEDFAQAEPKRDKLKDALTTMIPILLGFFAGIVAQMKGWF